MPFLCFSRGNLEATAASVSELPVGSSMYLKSTALMAIIFLSTGLVSLVSVSEYNRHSRWGPDQVADSLSLFAMQVSIADFTPADYTADKFSVNICSQHGFTAPTCLQWSRDENRDTAFSWVCGTAAANSTTAGHLLDNVYESFFSGPNKCEIPAVQCLCFPGYGGANCDTHTSQIKPNAAHAVVAARAIDGWCRPDAVAVGALLSETFIPGTYTSIAATPRTLATDWACSGRGVCILRAQSGGRTYNYSFCACNKGSWGSYCENTNGTSFTAGASDFIPRTTDSKMQCSKGIVFSTNRDAGPVSITPSECSQHGTAVLIPTHENGRYVNHSSFFRPQSQGVCACEPGYSGEQCLGGRPVSDTDTVAIVSAISSVFLLLGSLCLYRERKRTGYIFDALHITPGDFSIFVDELPELTGEDVPALNTFFSRWGAIHSISPAFNDEMLRWWRSRLNETCRWELIGRQLAAPPLPSDLPPTPMDGVGHPAHRDWERRLGGVPPLLPGEAAWGPARTRWMALPIVFENITVSYPEFRRQFAAGCLELIAAARVDPATRSFERCVITYEKTSSFEDVMAKFHDQVENMPSDTIWSYLVRKCLRRKVNAVVTDDLFFRGHALSVSQAPEPKEVLWDSLDTSPSERSIRKWVSLFIMVLVCLAIFLSIKVLPTNDPGIRGVLVSVFIVVLNMFVAQIWLNVAKYGEQDETEGSQTRSIFFKTLATQLTVMFAANIGVSGVPFDTKNGYILDFFLGSAGFMMRTTLLEAVIPPLMSVLAVGWRANLYLFGKTQSTEYRDLLREPPTFLLAERCAAFMRIVLMACAFSSGMPLLNLLTFVVIINMVLADTYALTRIYAMSPAGPELARALELLLIFGSLVSVFISWQTMRSGNSDSQLMRLMLICVSLLILWIGASYFTYKTYRKRDCFCGMGFLWLGPLFCFSPYYMAPCDEVNSYVTKFFMGETFYTSHNDAVDEMRSHLKVTMRENSFKLAFKRLKCIICAPFRALNLAPSWGLAESRERSDSDAHDETGGRTYTEIAHTTPIWELTVHPYCNWERAQLETWKNREIINPPVPPITGSHVAYLRTVLLQGERVARTKTLPDWLLFAEAGRPGKPKEVPKASDFGLSVRYLAAHARNGQTNIPANNEAGAAWT